MKLKQTNMKLIHENVNMAGVARAVVLKLLNNVRLTERLNTVAVQSTSVENYLNFFSQNIFNRVGRINRNKT